MIDIHTLYNVTEVFLGLFTFKANWYLHQSEITTDFIKSAVDILTRKKVNEIQCNIELSQVINYG